MLNQRDISHSMRTEKKKRKTWWPQFCYKGVFILPPTSLLKQSVSHFISQKVWPWPPIRHSCSQVLKQEPYASAAALGSSTAATRTRHKTNSAATLFVIFQDLLNLHCWCFLIYSLDWHKGRESVFIEASRESSQWWASKDGDIHELFASRFVDISIFGVGFVDLDENMANTGLRKKKKKMVWRN